MNQMLYAGDVHPLQAWEMLSEDESAVLVDVRTRPEWQFVGVPNLESIGKRLRLVEWQGWPTGQQNSRFAEDCADAGIEKGRAICFLCRSGVRSMHAAIAMTSLGYGPCYNVSGGFEGDKDGNMHRGSRGGWKVAGLPWIQE